MAESLSSSGLYPGGMIGSSERFAADDDGHAAERVVSRMIEAGWF